MKKYKICHMTSAHPEEDVRIFQKECVSLAKSGYDVFLVERGESYEKSGVHIIGVGKIPKNRCKRMIEGAKKVYKVALSLECDIYHFHDPELLPYALKLKKKGKKVIFDSHELYRIQIANKNYIPCSVRRLISWIYRVYENISLPKLDAVIFPSLINKEFPLPGKRKVLINNVPRVEEFYDRYNASAKKHENSVCMIGTLSRERGITELVKASVLAGCEVYIGGRFSPPDYEKEILSLPEAKNVHFLGMLDRNGVLELLQGSQIGTAVLHNIGQYSFAENLPTKAYEYMSLGLPVILSKTPYNDAILEQYKFGIAVDPTDIHAYATAIRHLLDHPEEAKTMGANGRRMIAEFFNWGLEAKKLVLLYEELLSGV